MRTTVTNTNVSDFAIFARFAFLSLSALGPLTISALCFCGFSLLAVGGLAVITTGMQAAEIERMLAQASEEERQMREFQMSQIRESWEDARRHKELLASLPPPKDFDNENAGPASALCFSGEDSRREERTFLQKQQMRKWIQEQVAEKATLKHIQREEEMSYAEMLRAIDEIREQTEREEQALRKFIQDSVTQYNHGLAEAQRQRRQVSSNLLYDGQGRPLLTSLPAFDESKLLALDASGHIIRRDMFKGFTDEQKRKILLDNQDILRQKSLQREQEKMREYDWMMHQIMALRAMEQAEYQEKLLKDSYKNEHLAYLRGQIDDQRRAKESWDKTRYGDIQGGFYDGFGKSCR